MCGGPVYTEQVGYGEEEFCSGCQKYTDACTC
jgi:hypothetical protein